MAESSHGSPSDLPDPHMDRDCVCDCAGVETVQQILARGYAIVLVVLAIGFVAFVLMTSWMAFLHPDRAKQFLDLYAGPALTLLGLYGAKAFHEYSKGQIEKKP